MSVKDIKKENVKIINAAIKKLHEDAFLLIADVMARKQVLCEKEELCDFAAFVGDDALGAMDLIKLFMGEDEALTGMDKNAALDKMLALVMSFYPENVRDLSDEDFIENVAELESLTWRLVAFDSLSEKYGYFEKADIPKKKQVKGKLTKLRNTACDYLIRKDLLTDTMGTGSYGSDVSQILQKKFDRSHIRKLAEQMIKENLKKREVLL